VVPKDSERPRTEKKAKIQEQRQLIQKWQNSYASTVTDPKSIISANHDKKKSKAASLP